MTFQEFKEQEMLINEQYNVMWQRYNSEISRFRETLREKYNKEIKAYNDSIDRLHKQFDKDEPIAKYPPIPPKPIRFLLNGIPIKRLSKKSGVPEDIIKANFELSTDSLSLLNACKIGIGLKRLGIYADEETILGSEKYLNLYKDYMTRTLKGTATSDDTTYFMMQQTTKRAASLTYRRIQMNYSRDQLAKKTNINKRTLEKYESGEKDITKASVSILYSLAKALECNIEFLINKEPLKFNTKYDF